MKIFKDDLMRKDFELIFVSGVHGSGKTTFCKKLSNATNAKHYSASELIRRKTETRIDKVVTSALENQEILKIELAAERKAHKHLIIDGHFCLQGKESNIITLGAETFEAINADLFICMYEDPQTIASRLKERDGIDHGLSFIANMQAEEIKQCKIMSKKLETPYQLVQSSSSFDFSTFDFD